MTEREEQTFTFDKFIDDIVIKERKQQKRDESEETPQRKYNRKYSELPQNRIKFGGK